MATLPPDRPADLPPDVECLAWLLGTWRGEGHGAYPSIDDFAYVDETTFDCWGKPFVRYGQRTHLVDGTPSHSETGYLRPRDGGVEGVIGEPIGIAETYAGVLDGHRLELTSTAIIRTPTAKEILGVHRVFELGDDGTLAVLVDMAAVGHPMGFHLAARLERVA